jgi:hypothetical protein
MTEKVGLPLNETTIAQQLKRADYATMAVGKVKASRVCFCPTMLPHPSVCRASQ